MNKETVKSNLNSYFIKREEAEKAVILCEKAKRAEDEANDNLQSAKSFIRKSIEDEKEVYIAGINGKNYKIIPDTDDEFGIIIKEINIIK